MKHYNIYLHFFSVKRQLKIPIKGNSARPTQTRCTKPDKWNRKPKLIETAGDQAIMSKLPVDKTSSPILKMFYHLM